MSKIIASAAIRGAYKIVGQGRSTNGKRPWKNGARMSLSAFPIRPIIYPLYTACSGTKWKNWAIWKLVLKKCRAVTAAAGKRNTFALFGAGSGCRHGDLFRRGNHRGHPLSGEASISILQRKNYRTTSGWAPPMTSS